MATHRIETIVNDLLARLGSFSSRELAEATNTTRQAVNRHLKEMLRNGHLIAEGKARGTRYSRPAAQGFQRRFATANLAEDVLWEEARKSVPELASHEAKNAAAILAYAATEMINNAIDHSGSAEVEFRLLHAPDVVRFEVIDDGVGVFENVRRTFSLADGIAALLEISKGKLSTLPERHSGEGIFFTSKMADRFELEANGIRWLVDNIRGDQAIGSAPGHPGTVVRFEVRLDKSVTPEETFARYTRDLVFDVTRATVKLFEHGVRFVSRSEAKRLVSGLEKFREVILDFQGVEAVGQGFVDEVFRVWASVHPEVRLVPQNMAAPVEFMLRRAFAVVK